MPPDPNPLGEAKAWFKKALIDLRAALLSRLPADSDPGFTSLGL